MLDEGLGLDLSTFGQILKIRPKVSDEHELVQRLANNLWLRQTDYMRYEMGILVRRKATSTEVDLWAMALRMKPHTTPWLYLSPQLCTLGQDAFDDAPVVVREIHQNIKRILDVREEAGAAMLQLMQERNMSLDQFQADALTTRPDCERSDAILAVMGVGW